MGKLFSNCLILFCLTFAKSFADEKPASAET